MTWPSRSRNRPPPSAPGGDWSSSETHNDLGTLVHYLGALAGGHVPIPVPADRDHCAIVGMYDPDTVIDATGVQHRNPTSAHRLHEDLALLLSTSGSTGSPKLVRLSRTNLVSNAAAIAEYLGIRETDRAATTLPMSYCYGLSVIHSHLLRGAGLILTDRSVVDDEFWTLFRQRRGTSFAGVPHTFDLLDRIGFGAMDLPHLRYVTQAGGRMPAERVRHFAALGQRRGWQLFVMYGATEATARMAYLPPESATSRPDSIGRPIPGGSLRIDARDGWPDGTGELVYRGPNVMMGYACQPGDLALGATLDELRTGDIARRCPDGLYEIIGRSSRFVKLYGLRIDLQRLETALAEHGVTALCTEDGDRVVVAATGTRSARDVQQLARHRGGYPGRRGADGDRRRAAAAVLGQAGLPRRARAPPRRHRRSRRHRSARPVRRGATGRSGHRRCRRQFRRPRRKLTVLCDDVGAAGTHPGPAACAVAPDVAARSATQHRTHTSLGLDGGDQRRAAGGGDRAHRRFACRPVQAVGRGASAARGRRLQLRPVLPHPAVTTASNAPPAQHHRLDRGALDHLGRCRTSPDR